MYSLNLGGDMQGIYKVENPAQKLRTLRSRICFPVINRGQLWYHRLTPLQLGELKEWYQAWLDAPETLVQPKTPEWINDKLSEEEIII